MVELCLKSTTAAADPGVLRANRNLSEGLSQEQEANHFLSGGGAPALVSNILMGHWCSDTLVARPLCRENRSRWQVKNRRGKEEGERQDL